MSPAMTAVLVGIGYAVVLVVFLSLCVAAIDGDRAARLLAPGPDDDDFALSIASTMYDYTIYGRWHP